MSADPATTLHDPSASVEAAETRALRDKVAWLELQLARSEDKIAAIQEIGAALGTASSQDDLLSYIMERMARVMNAERSTLYLLEDNEEYLWSRLRGGGVVREVRLRIGEGIAGWVARHGKSINVKDAYKDSRFAPRVDQDTGFRTQSVLCQPMRNKDGRIIGVVQVLNKKSGYFTVDDEALLSAMTNTAAIAIENNRLYLTAVDRNIELSETKRELEDHVTRLDMLYELQRRINEVEEPEQVMEAIAVGAAESISSAGCAISLRIGGDLREYSYIRPAHGSDFEEVPRTWDPGVRDEVLRTGKPLVCNTMSCMPLTAAASPADVPARPPFEVTSVCAVPLIVDDRAIGVIELVNRRRTDDYLRPRGFTREDERMLSLIGAQMSTVVSRSVTRERRKIEDRLAAIGRMLSGVVHDLKTPLTIASGYLQLMERTDDRDKRRDHGRRVRRQLDDLNRMTKELLAYARGESAMYARTVHMHVFAEELEEQLTHEFAGRDIQLNVVAEYRGDARLDDGKIKRALFNLARNAREAMPDGGTYTVRFERDGDELLIRSRDTGCGIPQHIQDRLFDAFVTSGKSGSTGLGLAIVRKLVEEHGGSIRFESEPGAGTEFTIAVPIGMAVTRRTSGVAQSVLP